MSYHITASGKKTEVIAAVRSAAGTQSAGMRPAEKKQLDAEVDALESNLNETAGDDDAVSVTLQGSHSTSAASFASHKSCGVSITRGAATDEIRNSATGPTEPGVTSAPGAVPAGSAGAMGTPRT